MLLAQPCVRRLYEIESLFLLSLAMHTSIQLILKPCHVAAQALPMTFRIFNLCPILAIHQREHWSCQYDNDRYEQLE